jgi:phosphatidate phosphatase APP1
VDKIENIIYKYPKRRFILIGNSAEHDPEMHGEVFRRFPDQVQKILIRDSDQIGKCQRGGVWKYRAMR